MLHFSSNQLAFSANSRRSSLQASSLPSGSVRPVSIEEVTLETDDRQLLSATLFVPRERARAGAVVINSATATPQAYYYRYAQYLARAGIPVLTYDYRGVGRSRPPVTARIFRHHE
jgi:predicted alpha/beta hydrolase